MDRNNHRQSVGFAERMAVVCFAMFLNAALYKKMFLESFSFELDLTLVFLALCFFFTIIITIQKGPRQYQFFAVFLMLIYFFAVPALSMGIADLSKEYPAYKALGFFTATLMSALIPIFMIRSEEALHWFLRVLLFITFVSVVVPVFIAYSTGALETATFRQDGFSANVIALSRAATLCILIALVSLRSNSLGISKIFAMFIIVTCILSALTTASRGPLFGMVLTFVLVSHKNSEGLVGFAKKIIAIVLLSVIAFVAMPYVLDVLPQASLDKLQDTEASSRTILWGDSWNLFLQNLEGVGFGGYREASVIAQASDLNYPHNIVLEYLVEMGLLGGILFLAGILSVIVRHSPKHFRSDLYTLTFVLFVFFFIQAQVSGSINGNRFLFLFIAIGLIKNNIMRRVGSGSGSGSRSRSRARRSPR